MNKSRNDITFSLVALAFAAFYLIYFLARGIYSPFYDGDPLWHLAAGDQIRELAKIPKIDLWSFTAGDTNWYNIAWAYDVLISIIKEYLGFNALIIFTLISLVSTIAILAGISYKIQIDKSIIATTASIFVSGIVLSSGYAIRPQVFSLLLSLAFYIILRFYTHKRLINFAVLPLLMILWVNIHGGFLAGFIIIGAFTAEAIFLRNKQRVIDLIICGGLCGLATLLNPYHYEVYIGVLRTLDSVMTSKIIEWRAVEVMKDHIYTIYLLIFIAVSRVTDSRIPLADKLLAIFWLLMGLSSNRNMAMAALMAAPYLAQCFSLLIYEKSYLQVLRNKDGEYHKSLQDGLCAKVSVVVSALFIIATSLMPPPRDLLETSELNPYKEVEFIKNNYPNQRFINDYSSGGFIIYQAEGKIKVFVDGRAGTAYSEELLKDYIDFQNAEPNYNKIAEKYKLNGAIFSNGRPIIKTLDNDPKWTKVLKGERASVYLFTSDMK